MCSVAFDSRPVVPDRKVDPYQELPALEQQVLRRWQERDVFAESLRARAKGKTHVFYEGPPTPNGRPGSHHVLTRVFKDMYMRYMTMCGYRIERKAGWDCHGLPVEIAVEQELGINHKAEIERYGIGRFNARCRQLVLAYLEDWGRLTKRIGFWVDLDRPYLTMDEEYIESVWWALRQIDDRGLLYEDHKVVPYCPRCGTGLSSHEVALGYKNVVNLSVYLRLPVRGQAPPLREGDELLVWTTMPWTLPANAALAVNPDLTYVRARDGDSGNPPFVLADALVTQVLGEGAEILDRFPGRALEGTAYEPPFAYLRAAEHGARAHTVLLGGFVTDEDGTGVVHTVPAFGEEDHKLGKRYGLAIVNPVLADGTYDERMGPFAGRNVRDAVEDLVQDLSDRGKLIRALSYEHSYPHCWRCETALLYYAKPSWYVATSAIREQMLESNRTVDWHPLHIRDGRFGHWLENNVDWALSRDRYWGTPLPVWRCANGHTHVIGSFAELERLSGSRIVDHHRPHIDGVEIPCTHSTDGRLCGEAMRRVSEVVDVWFDSGAVPFAQYHYPFEQVDHFREQFPADFICEAQDQTRGWFYSLLAVSMLLFDAAPYRQILCLGLILDADGQKMSKSRGNTVEPWEVTNTYGADAFRWYFYTAKHPWDGYRFSPEAIGEVVRLFLRKLWRVYSFYVLYAHANADELLDLACDPDGSPASHVVFALADGPNSLDVWILSRAQETVGVVSRQLDCYDANAASHAIAELVDDVANWYIRRSRRRFWNGDPGAFVTLRQCLLTIARLLAPFCPFVADEIYDNLDGTLASVHLCDFPSEQHELRNLELERAMSLVRAVVRLGLRVRNRTRIKTRQPLGEVIAVIDERDRAALEPLASIICEELNVKRLRFVSSLDELIVYDVQANYRTLGPLFGKDMPRVVEGIARLTPSQVAMLRDEGGTIGITAGGRTHLLEGRDLVVSEQSLDGYVLEEDGAHGVAIDVRIDDELRREGLLREIVRVVQQARKTAGLAVEARIELAIHGEPMLVNTANEYRDYLSQETLATAIHFDEELATNDVLHCEHAEVEGMPLTVALRRARRSSEAAS
jgi:isoleucyl-tRNA synthetase